MDAIAILDFGSQYAQLIARRVRELQVYCELFPWDASAEQVLALHPKGFILSGGPASVYEPQAPVVPSYVLSRHMPVLGICYGMQALTQALGGEVAPSTEREYGPAEVEILADNPLIPLGSQRVWMSHGDRIQKLPAGFVTLGQSGNSPIALMGDLKRRYFGLQFHPEVHHTPGGKDILRRFVVDICRARPDWTPELIIAASLKRIRRQVGNQGVLSAVSGGVDSTVATAIVQQAVPDQLIAIFVDTGMLRLGEAAQVATTLQDQLGVELITVNAEKQFLAGFARRYRSRAEAPHHRRAIHPHFRRAGQPAGYAAFSGPGYDLSRCGRVQRPRPVQGAAHQDTPQCGRSAG